MGESSRWYRQDGTLAPDTVPNKSKPGEVRSYTLADAKKEGAVRSVSVFLDAINKPGLQVYAERQLLDAVKRHALSALWIAGELSHEEEANYLADLGRYAEEHRNEAATTGTAVHAYIQRKIEGKELPGLEPGLMATAEAMLREAATIVDLSTAKTEASFVYIMGEYAGTPDIVANSLADGKPMVLDWKTQGKPAKKMERRETWGMQTAAYTQGALHYVVRPTAIVCGSTVEPGGVRSWAYTAEETAENYARFDLIRRYVLLTKGSTINNTAAVAA